ncbi:STY4528 family pathogenicity island replication protein [Providencia rettgeri]|uniref:STY4528 family pathogenicity island replication protein n=1 Tax=Providencia rettgeri TaxID=587 RepID=UPI00206E79D5|nr:STY4528 family pathogenicity island replication protein [Providencia rettgeri]
MQQACETLLQFTLEKMRRRLQTQQGYSGPIQSGLVFAGNIHDAIPRQLLLDPRLSPVDKLAWMMIRLHAQQNDGAVFPTYDELQLQLATPHSHKASRETISRALLTLRLTGWLSLCHRVRDSKGRIRGNIYMLHDEPVNAYDAETLDPRWMDVLEKSCHHGNKSVRSVALATLTALKTDANMCHQYTRMALIEQRLNSEQTPAELAERQRTLLRSRSLSADRKKNRTQSKKPSSKIELSGKKNKNNPSSKIELSTPAQSGSTVRKSNHYVRNSFTHSVKKTYVDKGEQNSAAIQLRHRLPDRFAPEDRNMLEEQLRALPNDIASAIVQQLTQGIDAGSVRNPVGYALRLLKSAREGSYNPISHSEKAPIGDRAPASVAALPPHPARKEPEPTPESRGPTASPDVARQYILNIRRTLAGVASDKPR